MKDRVTRARNVFETDGEPSGEPDRYHCLVEIGRGGMAVVYRAWDSHMNREVALKVAREEVAGDPDIRRRFEEESRIAGTFSHPNILPVFDRGLYQGRPYLAIQLIDGAPLDRAELPLREKMAHLATAAEAVDHAHARGVVHRDLKPSNILLGRDGRVYLTDFGVALQTVSEERRTAAGTVVGTPAYMSPEQARGEDVDARSDVYALGATLYELAAGRPPYEDADPQAVLEAVRTRPPPSPRKANPKVSRNVESIIRMAMERLPRDRYATARALADDLRLYQNHRRPLARARGLRYYVGREIVRHPIRTTARFLTAAIVAGALTLGGLVGKGWLEHRRALAEPDLHARMALLEGAAEFWPPARRTLKELRGELASRIKALEGGVREALDRVDFERAAQDLANLERLNRGESLRVEFDRAKAAFENRMLVARINTLIAAGNLDSAEIGLKELPTAHPDRDRLRERVREERFAEGRNNLDRAAAAGDVETFASVFSALASAAHAAEKNRDQVLGAAARTFGLRREDAGDRERWLTEAERRGSANAELYQVRGLARIYAKSWEAARSDLDRFRQRSAPGTPTPSAYWTLFHHEAKEAAKAGDWARAQTRLHEALELSEEQADLWHDLGLARWKTVANAELSFDDLDKALLRNPALRPSAEYEHVALAFIASRGATAPDGPAERDHHWSGLLERLDRATRALPRKSEDLRIARASLLRKLRRTEEALAELETAGTTARVRLARARVFAAADRHPRAYEELGGAPDDAAIAAWRAVLAARLDRAQAIDDFKEAQRRGGLFPAAHLEAARFLRLKDPQAALREAELALGGVDRLGEDDFVWLGAEAQAKPPSLARVEFRRACLLNRAHARFHAGRMAGCAEDATSLLEDAPGAPEPRLLRGRARRELRDWKGAAEDLEAYLRAEPDDARARLELAIAWLNLDRAKDAEEQCRLVLLKSKDAPDAFYFRGLARKALGNAVGARHDFESARELCASDSPLYRRILEELK